MLAKDDAKKVSHWAGDVKDLMQYGIHLTPLTSEEIKTILTARDREDLIKSAIPSECVAELYPTNNGILCTLWIQIKGWYGADKSYVKFTPDSSEQRKLFLSIAKKHGKKAATLKEEFFNY